MATHDLTISGIYYEYSEANNTGWGGNDGSVHAGKLNNHYVTQMTITSSKTLPEATINLAIPLGGDCKPYNIAAYVTSTQVTQPAQVYNNASSPVYPVDSSGNRLSDSWVSSNGIGTSGTIYYHLYVGTLSANTTYYVYFYDSTNNPNATGSARYSLDGSDTTSKYSASATYTLPTYTINYNANGGTGAPSSQTKTYDVALTLSSTTPTKASTVTYPTGTITISYNANGGSSTPSAKTGTYTNTKTVPYTFKNWNTNSSGTGTSYNAGASYTANAAATLYAQWNTGSATETRTTNPSITMASAITRANDSTTGYTVTFNVNGGSSSHNSVTSTRTITYTFVGWNTNASGTGTNYSASTAYTFSENDTLYAKWTPSYTNNAITLPTPTRSGYKFLGWATTSTASSGTTGSYTPSSNITLYAIWEALATMFVKVSNTYKVGAPYVKVNNTWKKAIGVYVKVGNEWKLSTR